MVSKDTTITFGLSQWRHFSTVTVILLSIGIAAATKTLETDLPRGNARSPISIRQISRTDPIRATTVVTERAQAVLGLDVAAIVSSGIVTVNDQHGFSENMIDRTAWLVQFEGVRVRNSRLDWERVVDVNVVLDETDRRLLVAFTNPLDSWVEPAVPERDPEKEGARSGWTVSPLGNALVKSSVVEVLEAVSKSMGVDPSETGQIVLRPRFVANRYPAKLIEGVLVPEREPAVVWIVQVLGKYMPDSPQYWTGILMLVDDNTLEVYRGTYMP